MEDVAAMFLRLDAEENGIAPQPVAPAKKAKAEVPSAFQHSFDRAIERYGILVRPQELVRVIEEGSALLVGPGFGDITIYNVPVKAGDEIVFVKVCYCPPMDGHARGRIITVLPPESGHWRHWKAVDNRNAKKKKSFARDFRRINVDDDFVNE